MFDSGFAEARSARLLAVGICLLAMTGCKPQDAAQTAPPQDAPPAVSVASPEVKTVVEWDEYTARLEAVEAVDVRARVSGYLESINFTEGSVVAEGSLLFVIDPRPFEAEVERLQAEVNQAEAAEENARARFNRAKRLNTENLMSEEEFQLRRTNLMAAAADVQSAKAALEVARLNLEYTEVRAPISGRISRTFVTEGNLVQGGTGETTLLTTIVSLDPVHAYFEASERAYLKYLRLSRSGQRPSSREARNPVYLSLADEEDFPHRGHMDFVDNLLDPNTGTMTGRAVFPNPDQLLTPGLFARVRLPGSGVRETLLIPDAAIGSDQTERYVYVLDDDNVVSYRKIEVGSLVYGLRVVREGLKPGERIVVNGLQRVRPGIAVTPEPGEIELAPEPLGPEDAVPVQLPAVSRRADGAG
jgi:RND family efflux transporter MFP subunit